MSQEISVDNLVFLDNDSFVIDIGVEKYREKYERGEEIDPIRIWHQEGDVFYARSGRHRTYFFYHYLNRRTIPIIFLINPVLSEEDKHLIENKGGVTVYDLEIYSLNEPNTE